jgi:hypothetical protein
MIFFIFFLDAVTTAEPTVMARPSGAPYVFYKKEGGVIVEESESVALNQEGQISPEDKTDETQDPQS